VLPHELLKWALSGDEFSNTTSVLFLRKKSPWSCSELGGGYRVFNTSTVNQTMAMYSEL
jgi:hypothetical protein